ncbi:hypothetical protein D3C85_1372490 [compost metagenome]
MPSTSTVRPIGAKLKKLKPSRPARSNSACTTIFGGVATRVSMPLIRPAKASGIISRMKMATTPVELITEPSPAAASINRTSRRVSLLPALATSQSPRR